MLVAKAPHHDCCEEPLLERGMSILLLAVCVPANIAPFHDWTSPPRHVEMPGWAGTEAVAHVVGTANREMQMLPSLLSAEEAAALHDAALRCNAYDESEPDTVDKAPTFQTYLFEDGQPTSAAAEVAALLQPIIDERILPYVRAKYNCPTACLADALLRRYQPGERTALGLHYDIEAFATCIIPLSTQRQEDGPPSPDESSRGSASSARAHGLAAPLTSYQGGLFVQGGASRSSRRLVRFATPGDCLIHQFDLMHGVEVCQGTRFAIALWFSDSPRSRELGTAPWVRQAADAGNPDAQFLQATFCAQGRFGNAKDESAAAAWLERGSVQGHAVSQLGLGRHQLGLGRADQAVTHFRRAAEQGHVEAQYTLALCYMEGMGAEVSKAEAARWLRRAVDEGGQFGEAAALELEELTRTGV